MVYKSLIADYFREVCQGLTADFFRGVFKDYHCLKADYFRVVCQVFQSLTAHYFREVCCQDCQRFNSGLFLRGLQCLPRFKSLEESLRINKE